MDEEIINTREIEKISFGLYSPEEILKMSVCKIDIQKKSGYGSVYDYRMGTTDTLKKCETCKQSSEKCPGHFGHIELNESIIHPLFYRRVVKFLNCFCLKCSRLLLIKDQIYLYGFNRLKGESRFNKIQEKLKNVEICCHEDCNNGQPICKFSPTDNSIIKVYEDKDKNKISILFSVEEIKKTLENISDCEVLLLGFDPSLCHPRNFIISNLPVLPPCDRPYVKAEGNMCDDDLTNQYIEIIKANNFLSNDFKKYNKKKQEISENKRLKCVASLKFRILTTFNNSKGKAKHTTNGRSIKGIKERLAGKDGQIRNNMMGKRCDQTARTVIGPDPTLKMDELLVPDVMTEILTIPVRITSFNYDKLQKMVDEGLIDSLIKPDGKTRINLQRFRKGTRLLHGDIILRNTKKIRIITGQEIILEGDKIERNGEILDKIISTNRSYKISIGSVVERKLQNGDYVLLNRQPTLHKGSMMAMKVKIGPCKTFRFNLSITKSFNADFDGDEMNVHVPQCIESHNELKKLSSVSNIMISAQSSKTSVCIVQDSLLGAYNMTLGIQKIPKSKFFDIIQFLELDICILDKMKHVNKILKEKGKKFNCYTGNGLISMFLPEDLNYEKKNDSNKEEPIVKIYKGVLFEGTINKDIIGSVHNSLIQVIHKEYGSNEAMKFIDCIQFVTNKWLLHKVFSIGLGDCLITDEKKSREITDVIKKCYIEAEGIKNTTSNKSIRELRVNAALNKAKDIGLRIAKETFTKKNNFLCTVNSGSKGDFFNIAQITGLLGQQNLKGKRIPLFLNHGRRTLPHYPFGKLEPEMEYESRGFISSSFIKGLNPRQFYFHAMSGREGISDTAMGTATSGYMQRRIIKLTEDIKIQYDGTVRNVSGDIYQLSYGENNMNPLSTVKVKGKQQICNISRIINRLNMKHKKGL
jgi:DNA-directed RNA polymerase beta' subunit